MQTTTRHIHDTFDQGRGILRLIPVFVPRRFSKAGRRLRLHPDDYYALGTQRGSIKERWFSSVIPAMNGELAPADEGMSYVLPFNGKLSEKFLLKEAVDELKDKIVGTELMTRHGGWPMYSKFFDYLAPLFHHLHLDFPAAALVGRLGKPEAYYFPPEMNNHPGEFPVTYFGFDPDVTRDMVRDRLLMYEKGDNRITELSRAYRIELGTGWYTPPGVVHAPGSYLTYEPQWNSDVNSVYENITSHEVYPRDFLVENCPPDKKQDLDYVMSLMDWEKTIDRGKMDRLRQRLFLRQGADRSARPDRDGEGRRGLRLHPAAGPRPIWRLRGGSLGHVALRPSQQRRVFRQRSRGKRRRGHFQSQPVPAAGHPETFRSQPSRRSWRALATLTNGQVAPQGNAIGRWRCAPKNYAQEKSLPREHHHRHAVRVPVPFPNSVAWRSTATNGPSFGLPRFKS
jgi:hypothetical protein